MLSLYIFLLVWMVSYWRSLRNWNSFVYKIWQLVFEFFLIF
ncbi:hypothetical protein NP493_2234g00006 [Ridgeia piscesae]|uniref:Uncharacterized protein n=1 Tax=Ridgeia piscesae TaxID=27915 RepID=A0AAD9N4J0_RIDPI|nr:hypothetical protein NP493_2234g00006 [Ridgeia piscesae]